MVHYKNQTICELNADLKSDDLSIKGFFVTYTFSRFCPMAKKWSYAWVFNDAYGIPASFLGPDDVIYNIFDQETFDEKKRQYSNSVYLP